MVSAQRQGRWAKEDFTDGAIPMRELRELRVGIFGLGGIGTAVARRALALGMSVAGVRRRPEHGGPKGAQWVGGLSDVPRLASGSDVLVIAAPHTTETVGAVDRRVLERLPHQALVRRHQHAWMVAEGASGGQRDVLPHVVRALDVTAPHPLPAGPL